MIPLVTEPATAAPAEIKLSDPTRRTAASDVADQKRDHKAEDKFADHLLRKPYTKTTASKKPEGRDTAPSPSAKQEKPAAPPERAKAAEKTRRAAPSKESQETEEQDGDRDDSSVDAESDQVVAAATVVQNDPTQDPHVGEKPELFALQAEAPAEEPVQAATPDAAALQAAAAKAETASLPAAPQAADVSADAEPAAPEPSLTAAELANAASSVPSIAAAEAAAATTAEAAVVEPPKTPVIAAAALANAAPAVTETPQAAPSPRGEKSAKSAPVAAFAQYLFGDPSTVEAAKGTNDAPADLLALENGLSAASEEADLEGGASKDAASDAAQRKDASPLLTPTDAAQTAASTLPPSLRRHLETHAASAHAGPSTPPISDAQHARLLQRVSKAFRSAEENGGEVKIRLSPPELGSMKLELSLSSGVLSAKLEVETQQAQAILVDSLPQLRDRLAEQGIRVEKFDVGLQQRDSGGQQPQQQEQHASRLPRSSSASVRAAASAPAAAERAPQIASASSRLNVII